MITSYAQALEDVVLFRALGDIAEGFYIDIGANDPVIHSVTKLFYDRGWRGINVEPSANWIKKIEADRPRDINLAIAVSDVSATVSFHEIESTGLSTLDEGVAARHESIGLSRITYDVRTETLAAICDEYAPKTIHFLKIDVEGAEAKVLRGADFKTHRPWIVLVEATEPLSPAPSHGEWDPWLTEAGYDFVLFDGLNRFYVAQEKADLAPYFFVKADDYQTISAFWTVGHWRRIAEERQSRLAEIENSAWWRLRTLAVDFARKLRPS
jgi:FkbM family methyltransferase